MVAVPTLLVLMGSAYAAEPRPLIFASDTDYAPLSYLENGEPKGLVIDIMRELAKRMGRPLDIQLMRWEESLSLIVQGKVDVGCPISITDARRKMFDFSDVVYLSQYSIFVRPEKLWVKGIPDLRGLTVGVRAGGLNQSLVERDPQIKMFLMEDYRQGLQMLQDGKIDAVIADIWVAGYILAKHNITEVQPVGKPVAELPSAVAVKKGNSLLLAAINDGLRSLQSDGTMDRIQARWKPKHVVFQTREQLIRRQYSLAIAILVSLLAIAVVWMTTMRREIRRRRQTEKVLYESEQWLDLALELSCAGIWKWNREKGTVSFDDRFHAMLGYAPGELPTTEAEWRHYQHPDDLGDREALITAYLEGQTKFIEATRRIRSKGGEWSWIFFRGQTVDRLADNHQEFLGFAMNITERKRAEDKAAKLETQLQQAQKMESVGRLAGGVAHDFNNMLSVILGHAELALCGMDSTQPPFDNLQEISKAAKRSADLTQQLLAFARKQIVTPKVLDINDTVDGTLKMLRRLIGEDIDLVWLPGRDLKPVKIDPSQIDQILTNLCINARDAIRNSGKVTIETNTAVFSEDYCAAHPGYIPGEYVLLAVSDNGIGMDHETVSHLFEPFFTTKGIGKGTGLGLPMVYGIVKQNNGFISVYSEPGQGTTFKIFLPQHTAKLEQVVKADPVRPAARGNETILLVEDEQTILELTTKMLQIQGYNVLPAATPGESIRLAKEYAGEIHLLMTDVVMPEMNGRDLANTLLSLYPNLKRLFMSGYTANVIAHHGVLDKDVHFIQKPFDMKNLTARVRDVLDSRDAP